MSLELQDNDINSYNNITSTWKKLWWSIYSVDQMNYKNQPFPNKVSNIRVREDTNVTDQELGESNKNFIPRTAWPTGKIFRMGSTNR